MLGNKAETAGTPVHDRIHTNSSSRFVSAISGIHEVWCHHSIVDQPYLLFVFLVPGYLARRLRCLEGVGDKQKWALRVRISSNKHAYLG